MHSCHIYGLNVRSDVPLAGAPSPGRDVDVRVTVERRPVETLTCRPLNDPSDIELAWEGAGRMRVTRGEDVRFEVGPAAEEPLIRHLVTGVGLGLALHQRGVFTLHASAVAIEGRAWVLMGPKGIGKSTLAATLIARGHDPVTDDVAAIDLLPETGPSVRRGPRSLNLWPDAAEATGFASEELTPIWSSSPKRVARLPYRDSTRRVPLAGCVILAASAEGERVSIEPVSGAAAISALIGHSHAPRWTRTAGPDHLRTCARILASGPLLKLSRPLSIVALDESAETIEYLAGAYAPANSASIACT